MSTFTATRAILTGALLQMTEQGAQFGSAFDEIEQSCRRHVGWCDVDVLRLGSVAERTPGGRPGADEAGSQRQECDRSFEHVVVNRDGA